MKYYLRILGFAKPYSFQGFLSIFSNLLAVVFSLFSVTLIIPILGILFGTESRVHEAPPLELSKDSLISNFNYLITKVMEDQGETMGLALVCGIIVLSYFFKNLFTYFGSYFIAKVRNGLLFQLRCKLHSKVMELPIGFFTDKRKGDLMARASTDLNEIEWTMLSSITLFFREPLLILGSFFILIMISPKLTLFIVVLLPVSAGLISFIGRSLRKRSRLAQSWMGELLAVLEENISGLRIIKAFTAEDRVQAKFEEASNAQRRAMNKVLQRKNLASPVSEFLGAVVVAIVIWFGGKMILEEQSLRPDVFFGFLMIFFQMFSPTKALSNAYYNLKKGLASAERVFELMDQPNPIQNPDDPHYQKDFNTSIQIKNIHFDYGEGKVIDDLSLEIKKGQSVALVGSSGSGKSTLANLIPRFYDITQGSIKIDGVELKHWDIADLRGLMGIVTQEAILFNDSVANNIKLGRPDASMEEIQKAAKIAQAHEFITEMPDGYESNIGESGGRLSGGQKQRISIARAVLNDPDILILDEATSALDTESEKAVQIALDHLMQNRTSIIIAHRLSTIKDADEIVVMREGKIVEQGKHDELIRINGVYHKLIELQSFD
jgi:subfamily B ATP-binding cassette protein MsbA